LAVELCPNPLESSQHFHITEFRSGAPEEKRRAGKGKEGREGENEWKAGRGRDGTPRFCKQIAARGQQIR